MGQIIEFSHKSCKFGFSFLSGTGFLNFKNQLNSRQEIRSGKWGKEWKDLIDQYPEGTGTISNALCFCAKCRTYFTESCREFQVPDGGYHYSFDGDEDMVPPHIVEAHYHVIKQETKLCPECKTEAAILGNPKKVTCPVCEKECWGKEVGFWD